MAALSAQRLAGAATPSTELFVRIFDKDGVQQVDEPLQTITPINEEGGTPPSNFVAFFALVEDQPDYQRVAVVDASDQILAEASYGTGEPSVTFTKPLLGVALGDSVVVEWSGSDPDPGDVLEYRLFYSDDGGATYYDVIATREQSATLDMVSMPTGPNIWFKLLVSDGLDTAQEVLGPFSIPNRPPEVVMLSNDFDEIDGTIQSDFGAPHVLRSYGYDSDDGLLTDASLEWTLSGPLSETRSGDILPLADLPPGSYQVELRGTDAVGLSSAVSWPLVIQPKRISAGAEAELELLLDGICQDSAYGADSSRFVLRYEDRTIAEVGSVRVGDYLHFCFSGLAPGPTGEYVEVRIDADASADALMQTSDHFLRLYRDGTMRSGIGDGLGGDQVDTQPPDVFGATRVGTGGKWQAEMRLHASLVGPDMRLGVLHAFGAGDITPWPAGLDVVSPVSWGEVTSVPIPAPEPNTLIGLLAGVVVLARLQARRKA